MQNTGSDMKLEALQKSVKCGNGKKFGHYARVCGAEWKVKKKFRTE